MSVLSGKKILLGVSGGIAAYKIPSLIRLLVKKGAEVKVIITHSAKQFVSPLTLSTLSNNPVFDSLISNDQQNLLSRMLRQQWRPALRWQPGWHGAKPSWLSLLR